MISDTMANEPALPPNSTKILVTGANGFVASHIVLEALKLGYHVRGTVRNAEKAEATKDLFQNHPKYSVVVVSDFATALTEIEHAVDGVESMIHVASDTSFSPDPTKVIPPVVNGILNVLRAAAQEPKVKRFTLTSSSVSVIWQKAGGTPENTITVDSWNDESVEKAWRKPGPDGWPTDQSAEVYCASKVEGEKAFWNFVKEEKPHYVANTVLPNLNLGRILPGGQPGGSGGAVSSLYHNQAFPGFAPSKSSLISAEVLLTCCSALHQCKRHCKVAPCSRGARWIACEPEDFCVC